MDKNKKEKEWLRKWAEENQKRKDSYCFPKIEKDQKSYFKKREGQDYLREYDFDTIPQLKLELEKMWQSQEYMMDIVKPVLVAVMKNKPENIRETEDIQQDSISTKDKSNTEKIPTYIYNF